MNLKGVFISAFTAAALLSASCNHQAKVTGVDVAYEALDGKGAQYDSATDVLIRPYKDSLVRLMDIVVAHSAAEMPAERGKPETLLGNFVADAVLYETGKQHDISGESRDGNGSYNADICLLNTGGLRSSLPKGDITRRNIFELMPFDNEITIVTLSGEKMQQLLRYVAMTGGEPVAGLKLGIRNDKTPGTVLIGGTPFDISKNYRVATSDYLAYGGDKMDFFKDPVNVQPTGYKIRDALLDYCTGLTAEGKMLQPQLDGRIYYETK